MARRSCCPRLPLSRDRDLDDPRDPRHRKRLVTLADLDLQRRPLDVREPGPPRRGGDDRAGRPATPVDVLRTVNPRADRRTCTSSTGRRWRARPACSRWGRLVRACRTLLTAARPLRVTAGPLRGRPAGPEQQPVADRSRVRPAEGGAGRAPTDPAADLTPLQGLPRTRSRTRTALVNGTDAALDAAVELLQRAALPGVPQAGWGVLLRLAEQAMSDRMLHGSGLRDSTTAGWRRSTPPSRTTTRCPARPRTPCGSRPWRPPRPRRRR